MNLKRGKFVHTAGVGGFSGAYESSINLLFVDKEGYTASIDNIPIYIIPDLDEVVIGRNKIFDAFKIIFEQYNDKIIFEAK